MLDVNHHDPLNGAATYNLKNSEQVFPSLLYLQLMVKDHLKCTNCIS